MTDYKIPPSVSIGGVRITEPLDDDVLDALHVWERSKADELVDLLAPFGLHPYQLTSSDWRRVLTPTEVREYLGDDDD